MRLVLAVIIGSIGSVGMWSVVVVLPVVQAEFGASRGAVSLAFTLTMLGFGLGGVATGKITDRFGIVAAMALSISFLGIAYILAGLSTTLWQFILVYCLIGLGTSATFAPLMAEASHWFERYRGLAVTIVASGNYVGGTIWPPLVNWGTQFAGWRTTHIAIGIFCAVAMTLVLLVLRAQIGVATKRDHENAPPPRIDLRLSTNTLTALLCIAGVSCCVAMAMPQVHIVAYCGDLGYGAARGAEMLAVMLGFGIVSRLASGWICDRIGGLRTLLLGSVLQGVALVLFLPFDGLASLYIVSALFGLFQGGLVPSYAIIVREYFKPAEAGARLGVVLLATLLGMAAGGWVSGAIFDLTGSYRAAFVNGIAW
ncbi:MAG TPA: MFS transporter, partial [Steroidobacteraceae bacterium]